MHPGSLQKMKPPPPPPRKEKQQFTFDTTVADEDTWEDVCVPPHSPPRPRRGWRFLSVCRTRTPSDLENVCRVLRYLKVQAETYPLVSVPKLCVEARNHFLGKVRNLTIYENSRTGRVEVYVSVWGKDGGARGTFHILPPVRGLMRRAAIYYQIPRRQPTTV